MNNSNIKMYFFILLNRKKNLHDDYKITDIIGKGGYGEVYLGYNYKNSIKIIKIIRRKSCSKKNNEK